MGAWSLKKGRGWYWKVYGDRYERAKVTEIESFCGWDFLLKLIKECENTEYRFSPKWSDEKVEAYRRRLVRRDQALIATLFETGGRVIEVLRLRRRNFSFDGRWIRVTGMQVVKRFRKDKRTGKTIPVYSTRGRFSIPIDEPLVPYMVSWVKEQKDFIFPSPKKDRDHLSTVRAYQIVNSIGERLGVHLYDHWFRAQRACQLAEELNFSLHELLEFFSWKHVETALRYSRLSTEALERKMRPNWFKE